MGFIKEIVQRALTFTGGRQDRHFHVLNERWTELDCHVRGASMRNIDYTRKITSGLPSSRSAVQVS